MTRRVFCMADERPCLGGPGTGLVRVALDKIGKAPDGLDPLSHVAVAVGQHVCHACTKPALVFCAATVYQITARACRGAIVVCHGACGEKLAYVKQISSYHLGRPPPAATINSDLLWVDGDECDSDTKHDSDSGFVAATSVGDAAVAGTDFNERLSRENPGAVAAMLSTHVGFVPCDLQLDSATIADAGCGGWTVECCPRFVDRVCGVIDSLKEGVAAALDSHGPSAAFATTVEMVARCVVAFKIYTWTRTIAVGDEGRRLASTLAAEWVSWLVTAPWVQVLTALRYMNLPVPFQRGSCADKAALLRWTVLASQSGFVEKRAEAVRPRSREHYLWATRYSTFLSTPVPRGLRIGAPDRHLRYADTVVAIDGVFVPELAKLTKAVYAEVFARRVAATVYTRGAFEFVPFSRLPSQVYLIGRTGPVEYMVANMVRRHSAVSFLLDAISSLAVRMGLLQQGEAYDTLSLGYGRTPARVQSHMLQRNPLVVDPGCGGHAACGQRTASGAVEAPADASRLREWYETLHRTDRPDLPVLTPALSIFDHQQRDTSRPGCLGALLRGHADGHGATSVAALSDSRDIRARDSGMCAFSVSVQPCSSPYAGPHSAGPCPGEDPCLAAGQGRMWFTARRARPDSTANSAKLLAELRSASQDAAREVTVATPEKLRPATATCVRRPPGRQSFGAAVIARYYRGIRFEQCTGCERSRTVHWLRTIEFANYVGPVPVAIAVPNISGGSGVPRPPKSAGVPTLASHAAQLASDDVLGTERAIDGVLAAHVPAGRGLPAVDRGLAAALNRKCLMAAALGVFSEVAQRDVSKLPAGDAGGDAGLPSATERRKCVAIVREQVATAARAQDRSLDVSVLDGLLGQLATVLPMAGGTIYRLADAHTLYTCRRLRSFVVWALRSYDDGGGDGAGRDTGVATLLGVGSAVFTGACGAGLMGWAEEEMTRLADREFAVAFGRFLRGREATRTRLLNAYDALVEPYSCPSGRRVRYDLKLGDVQKHLRSVLSSTDVEHTLQTLFLPRSNARCQMLVALQGLLGPDDGVLAIAVQCVLNATAAARSLKATAVMGIPSYTTEGPGLLAAGPAGRSGMAVFGAFLDGAGWDAYNACLCGVVVHHMRRLARAVGGALGVDAGTGVVDALGCEVIERGLWGRECTGLRGIGLLSEGGASNSPSRRGMARCDAGAVWRCGIATRALAKLFEAGRDTGGEAVLRFRTAVTAVATGAPVACPRSPLVPAQKRPRETPQGGRDNERSRKANRGGPT